MSSRREVALAALASVLKAAPLPAGMTAAQVHRSRFKPLESDTLPALVIFPTKHRPKPGDDVEKRIPYIGETVLEVTVEARATGEPPDQVLDELVEFVLSRLAANPQLAIPPAKAVATGIEYLSTEWGEAEGEKVYAGAAISLSIGLVEEFAPTSDEDWIAGDLKQATYDLPAPGEDFVVPPNTVEVSSGDNVNHGVGTLTSYEPCVALVKDPDGLPLEGVVVSFACPGITFEFPEAASDADGLASSGTYGADDFGTYEIAASIPGGEAPAIFRAEFVPIAPHPGGGGPGGGGGGGA